jgi:DNA-binding GntR family transcriptional regulator
LLVVRRTTHDTGGAPVLYSEHRYPADRTTFEIEFSLRTGVLQHA